LQLLDVTSVAPTWKQWVSLSSQKRSAKLRNGIPTSDEDLKYIEDLSVYVDYCTQDVFNSFGRRECSALYRYKGKKEKAVSRDAKEKYYNMFSRVAKDSNPGFEEDSVTRVSTSFPCSVSHVGEELGNLEVGDGVDRQQSAMFTNVKQESGNQQFNRNLSADESSVSQVKEEEGLTGEVTHAYQNPTLTQQSKRTPTILTESFLVKETEGKSETCTNVGNQEPHNSQSCRNPSTSSDRSELSDSKYVVYSNGTDSKSWHCSYVYLMDVLCERISEPVGRLQPIVGNLERRLFKEGFNAALGYDLTLQANIRM